MRRAQMAALRQRQDRDCKEREPEDRVARCRREIALCHRLLACEDWQMGRDPVRQRALYALALAHWEAELALETAPVMEPV